MAAFTLVGNTKTKTEIFESLVKVQGSIEVPLFVPPLNNVIVEVELEIVAGFNLGKKSAVFSKSKPKFDLI